jgi:hypothetical protein
MLSTKEGLMLAVAGFAAGVLRGMGAEEVAAQPTVDWVAIATVGIAVISLVATFVI